MTKSKDGKCPKCGSENFEVKVGCHLGSIYDDILECQDCKEKYECYQTDYSK